MATFRKRGSKWQAQVRRSDNPLITKTFTSKYDAKIWARMKEAEIDRGELPASYRQQHSKVKLSSLIERYLTEVNLHIILITLKLTLPHL